MGLGFSFKEKVMSKDVEKSTSKTKTALKVLAVAAILGAFCKALVSYVSSREV
jgi:hypothetical protein